MAYSLVKREKASQQAVILATPSPAIKSVVEPWGDSLEPGILQLQNQIIIWLTKMC